MRAPVSVERDSETVWSAPDVASALGTELPTEDVSIRARSASQTPTGPLTAVAPTGRKLAKAKHKLRNNNMQSRGGGWKTNHDAVFALTKDLAGIGLTMDEVQWVMDQCETRDMESGTTDQGCIAAHDKAAEEGTSVEYQLRKVWDHPEVFAKREGSTPKKAEPTSNDTVGVEQDEPHQPESAGERVPVPQSQVPEFPLDAVPGQLRAYVKAVSKSFQQTPDLAFGMCLFAASVASRRAYVMVKDDDWQESMVIWFMLLADSGYRKTPNMKKVLEPLAKLEQKWKAEYEATDFIRKSKGRKATKILKSIEDGKTTSGYALPENEEDYSDADWLFLEELQGDIRQATKPAPLMFSSDTTVQQLVSDIADNGGIMAVVDAESTYLRNVGGQYSGGSAETGGVNQAYEEGTWKVRRRGGSFDIKRAFLPTGIATQPGTAADVFSRSPSLVDSGFLWRFLFAMPRPSKPGDYDAYQRYSVPDALQAWWEKTLMGILERSEKQRKRGRAKIRPEADALEAFEHWDHEIRNTLMFDPEYSHARGALAKLSGNTLRIFGILYLLTGKKDRDTMEQAIKFGRYYADHARRTVGYLLAGQDERFRAPLDPETEGDFLTTIIAKATESGSSLREGTFTERDFRDAVKGQLPKQYRVKGGAKRFHDDFWDQILDHKVVVVEEENGRTVRYRLNI